MCWLRIEGLANMCLQLKSQVIHMCLVNRHALRKIGKSTERIHALFIVVLCPHEICQLVCLHIDYINFMFNHIRYIICQSL